MSFLRKRKEREYERPLFSIGKVTRGAILEVNFLKIAGTVESAPFVDARIANPNGKWGSNTFRARIDTGADISCIPRAALGDDWILPSAKPVFTRDFTGESNRLRAYRVRFAIMDRKENIFWEKLLSRGILLTNGPTGLLGMDVLKYFKWGGEREIFKIETL